MTENFICKEHLAVLRDIESLRREQEKACKIHEREIETAKRELDRRLESMNEFRDQLDKQSRTFMTRTEIEFRFNALEKDVGENRGVIDRGIGAKRWSDHIITVLIGLAVILAVWLMRGGIH